MSQEAGHVEPAGFIDGEIEELFCKEALSSEKHRESLARLALKRREIHGVEVVAFICAGMRAHADEQLIQDHSCMLLASFCSRSGDARTALLKSGGIECIAHVMEHYSDNESTYVWALRALLNSCVRSNRVKRRIIKLGLPAKIVAAMNSSQNSSIQTYGTWACMNIVSSRAARRAVRACGGIEVICNAMRSYPADVVMARVGCGAMTMLSKYSRKNGRVLVENGAVELIVDAMKEHPANAGVARNALLALWNLTFSYVGAVDHLLQANGIPAVRRAIEIYWRALS